MERRRTISCGLSMLCLSSGLALAAGLARAEEQEAIEEIETVEVVETVEAETPEEAGGFTAAKILGRSHAAAVHLPIGLVFAVLLMEMLRLIRPALDLGKSGLVLSIAAAASIAPAVASGMIRANELFGNRMPPGLFFEHRNLMIASTAVFLAALVWRLVKRDSLSRRQRYVHLGLVIAAFVLMAMGGHHGGKLVYGEDFLPY